MTMRYTVMDSPVGTLLLVGSDDGLTQIAFDGDLAAVPAGAVRDEEHFAEVVDQLTAYFDGHRQDFDLTLAPEGTDFQQRVWQELSRIPYGSTISYGELAANVGSPDDLEVAVAAGAEGSGLVRTEFLFQDRRTAPTVDEQVGFYTQVLRAFPGHRVVFRTMDIGADKPVPFITRRPEDNPALGLRGIRLHLQRTQLLVDQLTALLRARQEVAGEDAGRLAIMFPPVSTVAEVRDARRILAEVAAAEGLPLDGVEVGVMVEVPSAALAAARLAREIDFLSIGTNDLLQYVFAADRLNGAVAELADVCDPDVLALIRSVIVAGHDGGAWVGVCGEAAADPIVAAALVGLGVDELSMTRVAIPEVKALLAGLERSRCTTVVEHALKAGEDPASVRGVLEEGYAR